MKNPKRRYEAVDPNPLTEPVRFQRPPTLAEQIARYMRDHERYAAQQGDETPDDADDFGDDIPDDLAESPHELVYDEQLNRELTRYEKAVLDRQRDLFDSELSRKIREDKQAAIAAKAAAARLDAQRKLKKMDESADADEDS